MSATIVRFIAAALVAGLLLSCGKGAPRLVKESRFAMDTLVAITVVASSEREAKAAIDRAFRVLDTLGKQLDFFSADSEVTAVNNAAGVRPVKVSHAVLEVIEKALSVSHQSGGAFDITIGAVSALWDFHKQKAPTAQEVRALLPLVDYRNVVIDKERSTVFLTKEGIRIDVGAIAKGYGADQAVAALRLRGIRAGLVAVAGDIRGFGLKPDGSLWSIGIKNPRQTGPSDELLATLALGDGAISTSGDYERFFMVNGVRYHHLLDPRTGSPTDRCRSASVVASEGAIADAFSTALCILGPREGLKALKAAGLEGVIVGPDGTVHVSEGMKGKIEILREKS